MNSLRFGGCVACRHAAPPRVGMEQAVAVSMLTRRFSRYHLTSPPAPAVSSGA